ncbi:Unknown protein, partial [Striga hermonthica]
HRGHTSRDGQSRSAAQSARRQAVAPPAPDYAVLFQNPEFVRGFAALMAQTLHHSHDPREPAKPTGRQDGGRTTSHATSQPRDRMSQPPPEQNTRRTDAGRNPPMLPQEKTAESQSGHLRRTPPREQHRHPSNPTQTDLRQHIEQNRARQESSELETLRRRIAELESRQRAPEDPPRRASTSAQV